MWQSTGIFAFNVYAYRSSMDDLPVIFSSPRIQDEAEYVVPTGAAVENLPQFITGQIGPGSDVSTTGRVSSTDNIVVKDLSGHTDLGQLRTYCPSSNVVTFLFFS